MSNAEELARENQALRQRLSRLSEASRRINESLDFDTVLQGVLDSSLLADRGRATASSPSSDECGAGYRTSSIPG